MKIIEFFVLINPNYIIWTWNMEYLEPALGIELFLWDFFLLFWFWNLKFYEKKQSKLIRNDENYKKNDNYVMYHVVNFQLGDVNVTLN